MTSQTYLYKDFVKTISDRFQANLSYMQSIWNFEKGHEFEIAICKTLRAALPSSVGICRGHVVASDGQSAGDDIIIFDRSVYPTLRLLPDDDYSSKEWVPIEAVYAYIEAKHSIDVSPGGGAKEKEGTFAYACNQIAKVKMLCEKRQRVGLNAVSRSVVINNLTMKAPAHLPQDFRNPMFAMIIARHVQTSDGRIEDPMAIAKAICECPNEVTTHHLPDAVLFGSSVVSRVYFKAPAQATAEPRLFYEDGCSLTLQIARDVAFGFGIVTLLEVIDYVQLGMIEWHDIINDVIRLNVDAAAGSDASHL